jgi:hypothetical protein
MSLAVVLPDLDAARGGVAAYALRLAERLHDGLAATQFVALRAPSNTGRIMACTIEPSAAALAAALERSAASRVLLHYSGYGYAPDGAPVWLVAGLTAWKRSRPGRRLDVYFHELAAEEPWWTRTFWTQPRQRRIIRALNTQADALATNCPYFVARLTRDYGVAPARVALVPVPPTLAEPHSGVPRESCAARDLTALVFGLRGTRERTLREHRALLARLARSGVLGRVVVAGDEARPEETHRWAGLAISTSAHPGIDSAGLAALAATADFGLVWNWAAILTKSTVFANLCALGVPAVIARRGGELDGGWGDQVPAFLGGRRDADLDRSVGEIADPVRRAAVSARGLALAQTRLSWDAVAAQLETHFRR